MTVKQFTIELLYTIYKDKHFRISRDLRIIFLKRYNLTYQESNELILRIINYQVDKYGIQLYDFNSIEGRML